MIMYAGNRGVIQIVMIGKVVNGNKHDFKEVNR